MKIQRVELVKEDLLNLNQSTQKIKKNLTNRNLHFPYFTL